VIDDDPHVLVRLHHLLELGQLLWPDEEIEDGAEFFSLPPQPMRLLGIQPGIAAVLAVGVVQRAEPHAGQAVLFHPEFELLGDLGIGRIDQAVGLEAIGIALHAVRDVRIVPAVVNHLDQHRVRAAVLVHILDQHFGRPLVRRQLEIGLVGMRKRVALGVLDAGPNVHVGVDDRRHGGRCGSWCCGRQNADGHCRASSGGGEKHPAVDAGLRWSRKRYLLTVHDDSALRGCGCRGSEVPSVLPSFCRNATVSLTCFAAARSPYCTAEAIAMLTFGHAAARLCEGVTRRHWLRVGGLSSLGLMLPELLTARSQAAEQTASGGPQFGRAKSCIVCFLFGAPAHQDIWDLKPDAADDVRGPFLPVSSSVPGTLLSEHIPRTAKLAHQFALVRSVTHPDSTHTVAMHYMLTGQRHRRPATNPTNLPDDFPCYGAAVNRFRPSATPLPSGISLNAPGNEIPSGHIFPDSSRLSGPRLRSDVRDGQSGQ
jgi:hypothetical protein